MAGNGCEASLLTDVNNCGKCGTACLSGQACIAGACVTPINVAVVDGSFYSDAARAYLAQQPGIASATAITKCDATTLGMYKVIVLYGNMPLTCTDMMNVNNPAIDTYVQGGGGIVGTPWLVQNTQGLQSLPVSKGVGSAVFSAPLNVQERAGDRSRRRAARRRAVQQRRHGGLRERHLQPALGRDLVDDLEQQRQAVRREQVELRRRPGHLPRLPVPHQRRQPGHAVRLGPAAALQLRAVGWQSYQLVHFQ
jgi:hypothetical protein